MQANNRHIPDIEQIRSGEAATLERAATGFRDALEAERVYAAILSSDGLLRFKGSAPLGAGTPGPMEPAAVPGIAEAVSSATVCDVIDARPPFAGEGRVVAIPWTAAGEVLGVGVVVMPPDVALPGDKVLALLGAKVGSAIATLHDCDALARRVSQLHDAADLLDAVFEASADAMKLVDLDGHILKWNKAAEELYVWPEAEVIGDKLPHVPDELRLRVIQDIRSIAASGRSVTRDTAAQRSDGSRMTTRLSIIPYVDGDGNPAGVLSVARELRGPELEQQTTDMCCLLVEALGVPMASLMGYAQLLLHEDILEDATRRKRTVRAIEEHTGRLSALMEDAALVSHPSSSGSLDLDRVDVATLVADAVARFEQDRPGACRFVIDYDAKAPSLELDRRRMDRALQNLFITLLDQCDEVVEANVSITSTGDGAVIELSARTREDAREATDPYASLGTHIARVIVEAHVGTLVVQDLDDVRVYRIDLPSRVD